MAEAVEAAQAAPAAESIEGCSCGSCPTCYIFHSTPRYWPSSGAGKHQRQQRGSGLGALDSSGGSWRSHFYHPSPRCKHRQQLNTGSLQLMSVVIVATFVATPGRTIKTFLLLVFLLSHSSQDKFELILDSYRIIRERGVCRLRAGCESRKSFLFFHRK